MNGKFIEFLLKKITIMIGIVVTKWPVSLLIIL